MVATLEYKRTEPIEAEACASSLCCTFSNTLVTVEVHTPNPSEAHKNQYVFCGDNPVNFVDPWGLAEIPLGGPTIGQRLFFENYEVEGEFVVAGHGDTRGTLLYNAQGTATKGLRAKALAELIVKGGYKGGTVRLAGCKSADDPPGEKESLAQQVANELLVLLKDDKQYTGAIKVKGAYGVTDFSVKYEYSTVEYKFVVTSLSDGKTKWSAGVTPNVK